MSTSFDSGFPSYTAGVDIEYGARVALAAGELTLAGAADPGIGVARNAAAKGELVAVQLYSNGVPVMVASAAGTQGNPAYASANGRVTGVSNNYQIGIFAETSTGAGDEVRVIPQVVVTPSS